VTVWTQQVYEAWPPFIYEKFMQIKQGEKLLHDYKGTIYINNLRPSITILFKFTLFLATVPLFLVGWICRKGKINNEAT